MGVVKAAVADFVMTFIVIFSTSTIGVLTYIIGSVFGIAHGSASLFITIVIVFLLFLVFGVIAEALGGAAFNPADTAAFYAAGVGKDSLFSVAARFPAQAAGAVAGAVAILEVIPTQYKHMLGGPLLKVDLHNGAIAEGILTFVMTFLVFMIVLKGPKSALLKNWLLAMSTVTMVVAGSKYTGPSMNPANAFGWAYINNMHNTWEQFYVYWICPFIGAIMAAWTFRAIFPAPVKKKQPQKKKRN
ncbi:aquaporin SIP1-1-like isoform X1 [Solanum dulcamara]|uniref:aquaporin SIP1-1-like isoform X1 n=1 Tax=Solanum dulcamara TaxID=45834 RepID=UPI002484E75A|nr:aquaporin SIP1-1-like isoform X1 [Solanum dulcamara]